MIRAPARIEPFGDAAMLVTLDAGVADGVNASIIERVHALAADVRAQRASGLPFGIPVPGITTLLVPYDPRAMTPDEILARLTVLLAALDPGDGRSREVATGRKVDIEVRYGGTEGPDLDEVAERTGLMPGQVVEAHSLAIYRVQFLGFMPGFAYLGTLPEILRLPRRASPRTRVPAGSVAIAGRQTAVYPGETPGGWHLIGHTDAAMWESRRDPPALLRAGDHVRFVPRAVG